MNLSYLGIHELTPVPADILIALNPQLIVTAGSYENINPQAKQEQIDKHRNRLIFLKNLLPRTVVGARWWPDDNILLRFNPELYAQVFFPLHVPGTVLFVGNEDANDHHDPSVFQKTVALHTRVVELAAAAGISCAVCCMSTGNPNISQYRYFAPLFKAMDNAMKRGVPMYLRLNRYFTADYSGQLWEHEIPLKLLEVETGVPTPPILIGELGAVRSFSEPERGFRAMGWTDEYYVERLFGLRYKYASAVYSYGDGIFGNQWRDFNTGRRVLELIADTGPRTAKTVLEEWRARQVTYSYQAGEVTWVSDPEGVNVRAGTSTTFAITRRVKTGEVVYFDPNALVSGGTYRVGTKTLNTWIPVKEGFVAQGVIRLELIQEPGDPIKLNDIPFVSQKGIGADRIINDCVEAACLSAIHKSHLMSGRNLMRALTVDMLTRGRPDGVRSVNYGVQLLDDFGVPAKYMQPLDDAELMWQISMGKPVIMLVNYKYIGGEGFGHFIVMTGYNDKGFWIHDPYNRGANVFISKTKFNAATSDYLLPNGKYFADPSLPRQGIVLL